MLVDTVNGAPRASAGDTDWERLDVCAASSRGALSANTERAMRSDLAIYTAWCDAHGVAALPAKPETIAAFVDAKAKERAPSTVRRYVASIAAAHRAMGWRKSPGSEPVKRALQRMHRRKGRREKQAEGLTAALRQRLLDACGDDLIDARNRALLAVAYDTLLRRTELVSLQVTDIVGDADGAATVLVRRSKADAEGRGAMAYVAPDTMAMVCEWFDRGRVTEGRLFRSLNRGAVGERLDASQVPRIFKAMAERAGLPGEVVERISGHSTRVGAAQDMVAEGIGMAAILHAGRWKTTAMVHRYGERLLARRSGAAQLARIQHRA